MSFSGAFLSLIREENGSKLVLRLPFQMNRITIGLNNVKEVIQEVVSERREVEALRPDGEELGGKPEDIPAVGFSGGVERVVPDGQDAEPVRTGD